MPFKKFFLILTICVLFISCKTPEKHGSMEIFFTYTVDDNPIQFNQFIYTNAAGNKYQVSEVKYFISRLILRDDKGKLIEIEQDAGIHYVDCSLEKTLRWNIPKIPQKKYTAVSFVFGLDENDNKSNRFVNPPECNFYWPENLGGGYHYMQINGKFMNHKEEIQNMNIHTGIGQIRDENNEGKQFVHNYFIVTLPVLFSVHDDRTTFLTLNMKIHRWFDTPNVFNFNEFGTGIMQNQRAQELLKENGKNVFEIIIKS
jgi:hypothetical protein